MQHRLTFTEDNQHLYPFLVNAWRNGGRELSGANPANKGVDRRPGTSGGVILFAERVIAQKLQAIGQPREWSPAEMEVIAQQIEQSTGRRPTADDLDQKLASGALAKPVEVAGPLPRTIDFTADEYERLVAYVFEARWDVALEQAADMLQLVKNAEKVAGP